MKLPEDKDLAPFKLESLVDADINPRKQELNFAQKNSPSGFFNINGETYGDIAPRVLTLDTVDEWVLNSGQSGHPYHIHVNPFQIIEEGGVRIPDEETIWRDTVFVPQDETIITRTHYQRFDGEFVLHCHILDHEDNGMMQNVQVWSADKIQQDTKKRASLIYAAPEAMLLDVNGQEVELKDLMGEQLTLINYFLGEDCVHCNEQLRIFAQYEEAFTKHGIKVLCISSKEEEALGKGSDSPYPFYYDKGRANFKAGGFIDSDNYPKHGVELRNSKGLILFKKSSYTPYLDVPQLLKIAELGTL